MNKGIFLMFTIYLLVVNMGILGYFLEQPLFYKLALINAGVILVFSCFYAIFGNKEKKENAPKEKTSPYQKSENQEHLVDGEKEIEKKVEEQNQKNDTNNEKKTNNHEENNDKETPKKNTYAETMLKSNMKQKVQTTKRKKNIRYGQWIIFILSLIIAGAVFFIGYEFLSQWTYIIAIFMGFLAYIILGKLLDISGFHNIKGLFTAWIYYLILLFFLLYSGVMMFGEEEVIKKIDQYVPISRLKEFDLLKYFSFQQNENNFTGSKFEETHFQLGDGIILQYQPIEIKQEGEEFSGEEKEEKSDLQQLENLLTPENTGFQENILPTPEPTIGTTKQYTFLEAIKHLLITNKVQLSNKKNNKFVGLSTTNEDYPYFETALEKGLIGKNTIPTDVIPCDNYIVMKGLIEGRKMGNYNKNNILNVYWEKAQTLDKLNGCKKGEIVTNNTL